MPAAPTAQIYKQKLLPHCSTLTGAEDQHQIEHSTDSDRSSNTHRVNGQAAHQGRKHTPREGSEGPSATCELQTLPCPCKPPPMKHEQGNSCICLGTRGCTDAQTTHFVRPWIELNSGLSVVWMVLALPTPNVAMMQKTQCSLACALASGGWPAGAPWDLGHDQRRRS